MLGRWRQTLVKTPVLPDPFPRPPFGLQKSAETCFLAPLGAAFAPPHGSRTLSGPSKKRSERKMKSSKIIKELNQKSSPDYVFQIQDLPKRAPVDLMNFPEGSLRPSWRAPPIFGALPGPSWNPTGAIHETNMFFLIITKTTIFVKFGAHKLKPQVLQNTDFQFQGCPWSHLGVEPFFSGPLGASKATS